MPPSIWRGGRGTPPCPALLCPALPYIVLGPGLRCVGTPPAMQPTPTAVALPFIHLWENLRLSERSRVHVVHVFLFRAARMVAQLRSICKPVGDPWGS